MRGELAIHHLGAGMALGQNPFGRDVANLALFRAFARHGDFERLHLLTPFRIDEAAALEALSGGEALATQVEYSSLLDQERMARAGVLFRGKADLPELAWARRGAGPGAGAVLYSTTRCRRSKLTARRPSESRARSSESLPLSARGGPPMPCRDVIVPGPTPMRRPSSS